MSLLGKEAPQFTLPDTNRKPVSLNEYREGGKAVVAFFPAAFTGVCEKELCAFRDSLADFNNLNAKVIAISVDAPFSNGAFAKQNGVNFPVLSDYGRSTVNAYGVALHNFANMEGYTAAQRSVFVVGEDGKVTYEWIAPNPGVEPNYAEVKAAIS